jgi:hypothetical protein
MPWTQKPTSFSDFVFDANGEAPILVYRAADCPSVPDALGSGKKCYKFHEEWEQNRKDYSESYPECPNGDGYCLSGCVCHEFCSEEPDLILVVPPDFTSDFPNNWHHGITTYYPSYKVDWILAFPAAVIRTLKEKEPLAAIWNYNRGPRPWSQHGGDEDWTAVVRKSVYLEPKDEEDQGTADSDELRFTQHLDCCGTSYEDEEDFRVFTGAHA